MSETVEALNLKAAISLPSNFKISEVTSLASNQAVTAAPPLGPLAAFTGNWTGTGFNTIFRPQNRTTPTPLPTPFPNSDNILELNLTTESLSFSAPLGSVPNRGSVQGDTFLNGVPYLQAINDVTTGSPGTGIHLEPGLWVITQATQDPQEGVTLARMASIPHGTTIEAQGTSFVVQGPPQIAPVDITPTVATLTGVGGAKVPFPSQTAANKETPRIPQDLTSFIASGKITQAMLDDPNTVLRNAIAGQKIISTTVISISTIPAAPLFGGGTDNTAFLLGSPAALTNPGPGQNAHAVRMNAIFWIETVQHTIKIPIIKAGQAPLTLAAEATHPGQVVPHFIVNPPHPITAPRTITVNTAQIQYSQTVFLNFAGLSWPHVSVATLVPAAAQSVPPSAWN